MKCFLKCLVWSAQSAGHPKWEHSCNMLPEEEDELLALNKEVTAVFPSWLSLQAWKPGVWASIPKGGDLAVNDSNMKGHFREKFTDKRFYIFKWSDGWGLSWIWFPKNQFTCQAPGTCTQKILVYENGREEWAKWGRWHCMVAIKPSSYVLQPGWFFKVIPIWQYWDLTIPM